jgi:DNA-binding response OmpR family regulator
MAMAVGADAFLTKPFESQVLLNKIAELLKNNKKEE